MDLINQLFRISSATGISLTVRKDGELALSACQVTRQGGKIDIGQKLTGLKSLHGLEKDFITKVPVALNISGKGILVKQIDKVDDVTAGNFSQVLPNANFDDFYVQNFVSGESSFIAVIRKTEADKWLAELKGLGYQVTMLTIGPFAADTILPQLNFYDGEVAFAGHTIQRDEKKYWTAYRYDESITAAFPLKVESEKIDEHIVIPYANGFQLVMADRIHPIEAYSVVVASEYEKARSTKWAKGYGTVAVFVAFFFLIMNFLLLSWLNDENAKLSYRVGRSAQNSSEIKVIDDQVRVKELKLKALGWMGDTRKARLIDQLASSLPAEISWKSVEVNPIDARGSRDQRALLFKDGEIKIIGLSSQIIPVNEWMARIKVNTWVKAVTLESYSINQELNTGQFTIIISY